MGYKTYQTVRNRRSTPQTVAIPGTDQQQNNAGGYAWKLDDWNQLRRFLVLGTTGGTYYVNQRELTERNVSAVERCIAEDGKRVVDEIVAISHAGRAFSNDPALFALALCAASDNPDTRKSAFDALPKVARIPTHLFHFQDYLQGMRGWGRSRRNATARWYNDRDAKQLAYHAVKYQQRDGWSNRDLLRLSHAVPASQDHNEIYNWIVNGWDSVGEEPHPNDNLKLIWSFERAKIATDESEVISLIREYGLTREMIPSRWLNSADVWRALLEAMPLNAMTRNLGKMTQVGLIAPLSDAANTVAQRLADEQYIKRSRLHPLSILVAMNVYASGGGVRGNLTWSPVPQITDALDRAFYLSFQNVEPSGKRFMLALDVSGSMGVEISNLPGITARIGAAAMALISAATETNAVFTAFSAAGSNAWSTGEWRFGYGETGISTLNISPRQRLDDVVRVLRDMDFGATDCALPMLYATRNKINIDTFVVLTDSETYAGTPHPSQALEQYRQASGIDARLVVVGMVGNHFSIADPEDPRQLDVVGFDTATPRLISEFAAGNL